MAFIFIFYFIAFAIIFISAFVTIIKNVKNSAHLKQNVLTNLQKAFSDQINNSQESNSYSKQNEERQYCEYCCGIIDKNGKCPNCGAKIKKSRK